MSQKQKMERKKERQNDGDNDGQATHGARKPPGPKERLNDGNNNGQLRIANATSGGARKAALPFQNTSSSFPCFLRCYF